MSKKPLIPVMFRTVGKEFGSIIALFPNIPPLNVISGSRDFCLSYSNIGGYDRADYYYCVKHTKPVSYYEYRNLWLELLNMGYRLKPVSHISPKMIKERLSNLGCN